MLVCFVPLIPVLTLISGRIGPAENPMLPPYLTYILPPSHKEGRGCNPFWHDPPNLGIGQLLLKPGPVRSVPTANPCCWMLRPIPAQLALNPGPNVNCLVLCHVLACSAPDPGFFRSTTVCYELAWPGSLPT